MSRIARIHDSERVARVVTRSGRAWGLWLVYSIDEQLDCVWLV